MNSYVVIVENYLLNAYYVPAILSSSLYIWFHVIFTIACGCGIIIPISQMEDRNFREVE